MSEGFKGENNMLEKAQIPEAKASDQELSYLEILETLEATDVKLRNIYVALTLIARSLF